MSDEPLPTLNDARLYLDVFRAAARYRSEQTGRCHYCHLKEFRPAFVRRVRQLRACIRSTQ